MFILGSGSIYQVKSPVCSTIEFIAGADVSFPMLLVQLQLVFRLFLLNDLKVSYSCNSSIEKKLYRKIIERSDKELSRCNCRVKEEYPLNKACSTRDTVYEAKASFGGCNQCILGPIDKVFIKKINQWPTNTKSLLKAVIVAPIVNVNNHPICECHYF